ncbi:MAG: hypothetical protein AAB381_03405 [Patescibacteria group bacterium]
MALAITLIAVFIGLPAFFLFVFVYLPKTIRSYRLRVLAREFNLDFQNDMEKRKWWKIWNDKSLNEEGIMSNLLRGNIGIHVVEVFDTYKERRKFFMGANSYYSIRSTTISVDGINKKISDRVLFSGFAPIRKIRKELVDLTN